MITKINKSLFLPLAALLSCVSYVLSPAQAIERADSYNDALSKSGKDGILIYCYGPDWNARSVRMLKSFWYNNPDLEKAAGDAVLLAMPIYQNPKAKGAQEALEKRGNMPLPKSSICPSVLMLDGEGRLYKTLLAADDLIENKEQQLQDKLKGELPHPEDFIPKDIEDAEKGKLGVINIAKYIALLRRQKELMVKASGVSTEEKAKYICEACELGIEPPAGAEDLIRKADPYDTYGCIKRLTYNHRKFMDVQFEVVDGAIPQDFVEDPIEIQRDVEKVVADDQLRVEDRQLAYNLLIGSFHRTGAASAKFAGFIRRSQSLGPNTYYGLCYPFLLKKWSGPGTKMTQEQKDKIKDKKKEKEKLKRESKIRDRRSDSNFTIE